MKAWAIGLLNAAISGLAVSLGSLVAGVSFKQGAIIVGGGMVVSLVKWMVQHPVPGESSSLQENWLTLLEHHVNFGVSLTVLGVIVKEYKVYSRLKERVNELWYNYCGERQKLYTPCENGATPVIPPRPTKN